MPSDPAPQDGLSDFPTLPFSENQEHFQADEVVLRAGPLPAGLDDKPDAEMEKAAAMIGISHGMTLPNAEDVPYGAPGCQHCEVLPAPVEGPGTLHLRFPHTFTLGKILEWLAGSSWEHREQGGLLSIHIADGSLAPLLSPLMSRMSSVEQHDTRASFQPDGVLPLAPDTLDIRSLPSFAARVRADWLLHILREQHLYSVFQPILMCGDFPEGSSNLTPQLYGYECLMRADVDGKTVPPGPIIDMARDANLLFQLDLAARRAALTGAAHYDLPGKVFINFSPNSIYNPYSCLESTVRMADELKLPRERIVFEIVESERLPELNHLKRIVDYYHENGFGVALDDFGAGFSSFAVLMALRPDYVKMDRSLIDHVDENDAQALVASKMLETIQGLGLQVVAEGVERREEWDWLRARSVDYAQGFFFARPSAPPPPWAAPK